MFDQSFLMNRIYRRSSLKNNGDGFEFTFDNAIGNGTLGGLKSLSVDGFKYPLEAVIVKTADGIWPAHEIGFLKTVPLRVGGEVLVSVKGQLLSAGLHNFSLTVAIVEAGQFQLKFSDTI